MARRIVVLGCGFVGLEVARLGLARGLDVIGTTRGEVVAHDFGGRPFATRAAPVLTRHLVASFVGSDAAVLVTFPPDGRTDGDIAPALAGARTVYISTTGVYG